MENKKAYKLTMHYTNNYSDVLQFQKELIFEMYYFNLKKIIEDYNINEKVENVEIDISICRYFRFSKPFETKLSVYSNPKNFTNRLYTITEIEII